MKKSYQIAAIVFVITTVLYSLTAALKGHLQTSQWAYFNLLADSFLHGRLYLLFPPNNHDLTLSHGKWFVPFLPLPTFLMLPWVAIAGLARTNTVFFGVFIGAANTALVFLLLQALVRRGFSQLGLKDQLGYTLFWGIGSLAWYMSIQGSVWFLSQICTATFMLLAIWVAIEWGTAWLSGAMLALAMWGRPTVALMFAFLVAVAWQQTKGQADQRWQKFLHWVLQAALPMLISAGLILWYNFARFGNPLDFGYLAENVDPSLVDNLKTYGQFSLHFVGRNVWAMLLALPVVDQNGGGLQPDPFGMSIFITMPAMLALFTGFRRNTIVAGAWAALGLLLVPLMLYYNTGWWQFGYRFILDVMPLVMVIFAAGVNRPLNKWMWTAIGLGVLVNAWGVLWF